METVSEYSSTYPPHWFFNDVLHNRIVVEVEETDTGYIVTARRYRG